MKVSSSCGWGVKRRSLASHHLVLDQRERSVSSSSSSLDGPQTSAGKPAPPPLSPRMIGTAVFITLSSLRARSARLSFMGRILP